MEKEYQPHHEKFNSYNVNSSPSISNMEYSKFFKNFDNMPTVRTGSDDVNTSIIITYVQTGLSAGRPETIKVMELNPDSQADAKLYTFSYDDPSYPNNPTRIDTTRVKAI